MINVPELTITHYFLMAAQRLIITGKRLMNDTDTFTEYFIIFIDKDDRENLLQVPLPSKIEEIRCD